MLCGEIGPSELNEKEVNEMTEYFKKDIQNIDNELLRIKQHILYMQKELKKSAKVMIAISFIVLRKQLLLLKNVLLQNLMKQ